MESLPTAKGFVIWIFSAIQAAFYHSVTHKPPDYKNNGSCMAVIKLLSKDFSERRKPVLLLGFQGVPLSLRKFFSLKNLPFSSILELKKPHR